MTAKTVWVLAKKTVQEWQEDNALRLGAALSYYTVFSLAPLLIIVIGIAALVFGNDVARDRILEQLQVFLGKRDLERYETFLPNSRRNLRVE